MKGIDMGLYKCPKCDRVYTFEETLTFKRVPVVPGKEEEYGYDMVCPNCGARFWRDRMIIKDYIDLGDFEVEVSTVDLGINHLCLSNDAPECFYETMLFFHKKKKNVIVPEDEVVARYKTRDKAKEGHKKIVELIKKGKAIGKKKVIKYFIKFDVFDGLTD